MSSKSLLRIIKILIFVVVIGTPFFYVKQTVFPFTISKMAFFQSLVEFIFFLWLALVLPSFVGKNLGGRAISDKKYRPRRTPALLGLAAFLAVLVFTAALGLDPWRSFWSTYERTFGVVTFLHLGALALVLSAIWSEIPWKKLAYSSIVTCAIVDIIAALQLWKPALLLNEGAINRAGSTFDNPSFLAGYVLFHVFLCLYVLFTLKRGEDLRAGGQRSSKNLWIGIVLFVILVLNVVTIFITQTRAAILALVAGFFVLFLFFAFRPPDNEWLPGFLKKKWFYAAVIAVIVLGGALFWFTRDSAVWAQVPGLGRFRNISLTGGDTLPRVIALSAAWRGFLDKPFLGWGWENFNIVFNKYYDPRSLEFNYEETRFDKPHNFFMEYLVAGGVLLALGFLVMLGILIYEARRHKEKLFYPLFLAAIVAYLVQNLFLFDTLGPALMFFALFGYMDGYYAKSSEERPEKEAQTRIPTKVSGLMLAVCALVALVFAYQFNFLTVEASYYEWRAFNDFFGGKQQNAIEDFKTTLSIWSPYRWNFGRDFAANVIMAYFYNQGAVSDNEALLALSAMEEARDEHPLDAYNHYALVDMYNEVSDIDIAKYTALAEKEAATALALSPNRQEVYFSLAKTKHIEGDDKAALELAKRALDLDPKVPDAHFYYGVLLFSTGDQADGYAEVKEAISLGREWKNFYEPRTIAGFFGDFDPPKHLDEAIDLYKTALSMQPDDLETQIKLGVAYYFKNDFTDARDYLSKAATRFNFRSSPEFAEFKPILNQLGINY